jgi:hypothetical protein
VLAGDGHVRWNEENSIIMQYQWLLLGNSRHSLATCSAPAATPTASIGASYLIKSLSVCSLLVHWDFSKRIEGVASCGILLAIASVVYGAPVPHIRNALRVSRPGRPQQDAQWVWI